MINLLEAIKTTIERFIVGRIAITTNLLTGDTQITVTSTRRFKLNDRLAILNKPQPDQPTTAEIKQITCIPDNRTIIIDEPLSRDYPLITSAIEKTHYGSFLDGIYLGNPQSLPNYPAITIELESKQNEPLTLENTTETYNVLITVYSLASDFESQYKTMLHYASEIEHSLFRTMHPLVQPYRALTLAENVEPTDSLIRITEDCHLPRNTILFLESVDNTRQVRVKDNLGNNIVQLTEPTGNSFAVNDSVIQPGRWFYVTYCEQINVGTINSTDGVLKMAQLRYICKEERRRFGKNDPLYVH